MDNLLNEAGHDFITEETIAKTIQGRPLKLITITDPKNLKEEDEDDQDEEDKKTENGEREDDSRTEEGGGDKLDDEEPTPPPPTTEDLPVNIIKSL